jgi:octopine/nopaline transport system substrate-binding protein
MKLLKTISLAVLASAIAVGGAAAQGKKWDTVKIATEGAYAPWNMQTAGGKLEGFEIDLANELCARMKVKCEIVAQDWDGIIPALSAKKYDAIMAGMSITEERMKTIDFSRSYANDPNGWLVPKNSDLAKMPGTGTKLNLDTQTAEAQKAIDAVKPVVKGKTVGVQGSTTHANFVEKYFKDAVTVREYKNTEAHDLDLAAGRIDAVTADSATLRGTLEKPEFKDYVLVGPGFVGGVLGKGVGVGLRKEDADLKKMFSDAIDAAIKDGTVKKLSDKWFKADLTPVS